ncbi:MAG: ABC transporter substrate-binding protein [Armatimonadetes bacterium]|nr:ABC transporter substrate-binding protein [Armatimonadota bacterium]
MTRLRMFRSPFGSGRIPAASVALGLLAVACAVGAVGVLTSQPPRLRIGVTGSLESALVSYADASGAFRRHDLDVTIVQFATVPEAISAFKAEAVDGIVVANAALAQNDLAVGEVLVPLSTSTGSDVVLARSAVMSRDEVRGARFLVDIEPRSTWMLRMFLRRWGVDRQEVTIVSSPRPYLLASLESGPFDFVITSAPTSLVIRSQTGLRPVFNSLQARSPVQMYILANRELVRSHPEMRVGFRAALADCMREYARTPQPLTRYLASYCGIPLELAAKCIGEQIEPLPSDADAAEITPRRSRPSQRM